MKRRTPEEAIEYLMGDGSNQLRELTSRLYEKERELLMSRLDKMMEKTAETGKLYDSGVRGWMCGALDGVEEFFGDEAAERGYLEHENHRVRFLYHCYCWQAAQFLGNLNATAGFIKAGDINAATQEAFKAGVAFGELNQDLLTRRKQKALIDGRNSTTQIAADEIDQVRALNRALESEFPVKTPRYQAIADKLDLTLGRVRYIVEGPRR